MSSLSQRLVTSTIRRRQALRYLQTPRRHAREIQAIEHVRSRACPYWCSMCVMQRAAAGDHSDYLAMLRRMMRAGGRRLAQADPEDLTEMLALRAQLDQAIADAVDGMRSSGRSWAEIAGPLGMSKQAAHQRWGRR